MFGKKIIAVTTALAILTGITTPLLNVTFAEEISPVIVRTFNDMNMHWSSHYVDLLASKGAIGGYLDGTFRPDETVTVGEFLSIAMGAVYPGSNKTPPTSNHWASGIVDFAVEKGVLRKGEIKTDSNVLDSRISRFSMAFILVRLGINALGEPQHPDGMDKMTNYMLDYSTMSDVNKEFVSRAYLYGLITGTDALGTFIGSATGTRAEAATMVVRLIDKSARADVDLNKVISRGNLCDNGMPTVAYTQKMAKEALKTAKVYQKNGKYYITATLPELDPGMSWEFDYTVVNDKKGYETDWEDDYGTEYHQGGKTVTYYLNDTTAAQVKSGFDVYLTFCIENKAGAMAQLRVDTIAKTKLFTLYLEDDEVSGYLDGDQTAEPFDTTTIFAGWK